MDVFSPLPVMQVYEGVLVHQTRAYRPSVCTSRLSLVRAACQPSPTTTAYGTPVDASTLAADTRLVPTAPYGKDPVFDVSSSLYDNRVEGREGNYYNTSEGSGEISAAFGLPSGFFYRALPYHDAGFPVAF